MIKTFIGLSGIPRSGSQVLSSMLNQHPLIHSTTTSPVADLLGVVANNWPNLSSALLNPHPDQFKNIVLGVLEGAYRHIDKAVIVDKNRLWPRYSELMNQSLGTKPKIICTVRSIPEVLSSYILLIEKNHYKTTYIDKDLLDLNLPINNKNRCKILWEKYVIHPYNSLRIGANSGHADLLFVEYDYILNQSQETVNKICEFIGIETFALDRNNLQPMDENDNFHGGLDGLHQVRPNLSRTSPNPEVILGVELTKYYQNMNLEFWRKL